MNDRDHIQRTLRGHAGATPGQAHTLHWFYADASGALQPIDVLRAHLRQGQSR